MRMRPARGPGFAQGLTGYFSSALRSTRFFSFSIGDKRSPTRAIRRGIVSMRKSSMRMPRSISLHFTGADTVARGVGRTEYAYASVRPQAFWL